MKTPSELEKNHRKDQLEAILRFIDTADVMELHKIIEKISDHQLEVILRSIDTADMMELQKIVEKISDYKGDPLVCFDCESKLIETDTTFCLNEECIKTILNEEE